MKIQIRYLNQEFNLDISDLQSLPEELRQALVVRLTDNVSMFGATFRDQITDTAQQHESRYSVQIHPYPWQASGASNVIVHRNVFNELSVALVYNQRRDRRPLTDYSRQAGIPDFWKLPEGYMHPRPCKGGENGIALVSADAMDEAEVLVLKGVPMAEAYKTIKEKKIAADTSSHTASHDKNLKECALRESREEIGLKFSSAQIQFVRQVEQANPTPTIANVFLIQSKSRDATAPALTADGIEVREAMWGKLRAFRFEKDSKPEQVRVVSDYHDAEGNCHSIEIPMSYALSIGHAIRKLRAEEIQKNSALDEMPLFNSRENVEARVKQILNTSSLNKQQKTFADILGASPESLLHELGASNLPGETTEEKSESLKALASLGKHADNYHRKIATLASALKSTPLDKSLNAGQLAALVTEGLAIESSLLSSKARLFPLARLHPDTREDLSYTSGCLTP